MFVATGQTEWTWQGPGSRCVAFVSSCLGGSLPIKKQVIQSEEELGSGSLHGAGCRQS